MPKIKTAQMRYESALIGAIARAMNDCGMRHDCELADRIGLSRSTVCKYREKKFQSMRLKDFASMARAIGLTGKEVCAAVGVPYEES